MLKRFIQASKENALLKSITSTGIAVMTKTPKIEYHVDGWNPFDSLEDAAAYIKEYVLLGNSIPNWLTEKAPDFLMVVGEHETEVFPPRCLVDTWQNMWDLMRREIKAELEEHDEFMKYNGGLYV